MRDVLEVLRQKELEIERVKREINAVRLAAVLLLLDDDTSDPAHRSGELQCSKPLRLSGFPHEPTLFRNSTKAS